MTRRLAQWMIGTILALVSCSHEHVPPAEDSQTHWLRSCENTGSCAAGLECVCGRCVVTCREQVCNVANKETQCVEPRSAALQSLCDAQSSGVAICLEGCDTGTPCSNGQQCVEGVCVPKTSAGCELAGVHYEPGASVPSGDCNACTCNADGSLQCTTIACPSP